MAADKGCYMLSCMFKIHATTNMSMWWHSTQSSHLQASLHLPWPQSVVNMNNNTAVCHTHTHIKYTLVIPLNHWHVPLAPLLEANTAPFLKDSDLAKVSARACALAMAIFFFSSKAPVINAWVAASLPPPPGEQANQFMPIQ